MSVVFKCKLCGGDIEPNADGLTGKCLYCNSIQTLPKEKDDKIQNILNRANDFRMNSDFDRAIYEYEEVLKLDETEPEAHWGIFLSRYGVEYVKDPYSYTYKPTIHRITSASVFDDPDYKATIKYAFPLNVMQYENNAALIEEVMKEFLYLSSQQEKYDIFLSYKEADDLTRQRTEDSYLAYDLYAELKNKGYKVFFAPKSLGAGLFEPKIYSAIVSSKIMIVLGTKEEHFNAVWVKNEWSRYVELIEHGEDKTVIPVLKGMNADKLPTKLAKYQALNYSDINFLEKLIAMISDKIFKRKSFVEYQDVNAEEKILERGFIALENSEFSNANVFFENALNLNPHSSQAYFGKLMAEMRIKDSRQIIASTKLLSEYNNFNNAVKFADQQLKITLLRYEQKVKETILGPKYQNVVNLMKEAKSKEQFLSAEKSFREFNGFENSSNYADECKNNAIFISAEEMMAQDDIDSVNEALRIFESIENWRDSKSKISECKNKIKIIKDRKFAEEQARIKKEKTKKKIIALTVLCVVAITAFVAILIGVIIPKNKLKKATELLESGNYESAYSLFEELDKNNIVFQSKYDRAIEYKKSENYLDAYILFNEIKEYQDSSKQIDELLIKEPVLPFKTVKVKDTVFWGQYEQDNNTENGKEKIEWIILEKNSDKAFVISKFALDAQKYNSEDCGITWDSCTLRTWLNDTFYYNAFSKDERSRISTTKVAADKNIKFDCNPGEDTNDKIFLLSLIEAENYFSTNEERICDPTVYVENLLTSTDNFLSVKLCGEDCCEWMLRTPGQSNYYIKDNHSTSNTIAYVETNGKINYNGRRCTSNSFCVRPAMWVDIK